MLRTWPGLLSVSSEMTLNSVNKDISVVGFNNTVAYKNGDPKVNDLGSGNTIKKS